MNPMPVQSSGQGVARRGGTFQNQMDDPRYGFAQLDRQGHFVAVNPAYAAMLGWEEEQLLGRHWNVTVFAADQERVAQAYHDVREAGQVYVEFRGNRRDGRLIYQGLTLSRILIDGVVAGFHCLRHDITNRQNDQETLALAVESAPNGLLILNARGEIQTANRAVEQLFQYSREELLGHPVEMLLPARFHQAHVGHREAFAKNEAMQAMAGRDLAGLRKDGQEIPLQVHVNAIETPHGKLILATIIDIAERKKYQLQLELAKRAAEAASLAKSDFLARMSHEIRTPMNLIMGMNTLLLESDLNPKQRQHVEISHRNLRRLLRLINGILDLSKVEAGKLTLEKIPFHLNEVLQEGVATLSAAADQKGLRLSFHLAPDLWPYRIGDPARLQQVLLNLLSNAIKFTASGSIHVVVGVAAGPEAGGLGGDGLRFEVTDTGCGIPEDQREVIFQAFQQVEGSMNRTYEGTGLGLAIAQNLVELMGGRIWVEPREDPGTKVVFTACFPRAEPRAVAQRAAESSKAQASKKIKAGTRILVAEDNEENVLLLEAYLDGQSVVIHRAANGLEAVQERQQGEYDLVLMDIQMPVMDGHTATREIRKWEREWGAPAVPIVALTAHALAGAAGQCREAGCDGYLSKPLERAELMKSISHFARNHTAPSLPGPLSGIAALRPRYLANRRNDIENLRKALQSRDFDTVRRIAHDCKGTGAGYGFPGITAVSRVMEQAAREQNAGAVEAQIQALQQEVASAAAA